MKKYFLTLAAVCSCATTMALFSACSDKDEDPANPVETPSAVDNGTWHVTDDIMDKSVRPGDDFFWYCNGGYWNTTVVDETNPFKRLFTDQIMAEMDKREAALTLPSKTKVLADIEKTDEATIAAQKATLEGAIDRVNATTTKEEAWQLMAELYKEGYRIPLEPTTFFKNGKMALVLYFRATADYNKPQLWNPDNLTWRLANDPDVLSKVLPLQGAATRGIDNEKWPMLVTFFNTLGVSLDDVYTIEELPAALLQGAADNQTQGLLKIQDWDVDDFKQFFIKALQEDEVFFDETAAAAVSLTCKDAVDNFLTKALRYELSCAFGKAYVTAEQKKLMSSYAEELRQTFRERIQQYDWMSEASKSNALKKINNMVFNIGAPDEWFDEGIADLSQEQTLFDDIRALRRATVKLTCKLTGMSTKRSGFHQIIMQMALPTVNSCYSPSGNFMNILPAYMLAPTFNPQQNDAHNYANMMCWGHEITHGFDTNGSKFNTEGDYGTLWATETDAQEFARRAQLLIDYYSSFDIMPFETGLKNDGTFTVSENVADLGGFFLAYDSYVKHLAKQGFKGAELRLQKQRFYEAYGYLWGGKWTAAEAQKRTLGLGDNHANKDIHSMFRERVNGIVSNTDDWYDLFDVKPGDKLYLAPENRIRIW